MICPICGKNAPQGRITCGERACVAEWQHRCQKRVWANPERREAQSRRISAAKKASRLLEEVLKASREGRVTIQ